MEKAPAVWAATRIVERLAAEWPRPILPGVLVQELGLNRSTCYNILATLQRAGWVTNPGGRRGYTLGPRLLALTGVQPTSAVAAAQSEINKLSRQLGFSAYAAEWEQSGEYLVVAKAEPESGIHIAVTVGSRISFSAPALLGAFAAWTHPDRVRKMIEQHGLKQFTGYSVSDPDQFIRDLATVREQGYGKSLQQFNMSQGAVAAPIFDEKSRPILAICVIGFADEMTQDTIDDAGRAVRDAADAVTMRIGGVRPE